MRGTNSLRAGSKALHLEAIRGIAAFAVLFSHTGNGFFPWRTGWFEGYDRSLEWAGHPLFVLMNGASAVSLFFVLSGYVLSRKYLLTRDRAALVKGAIKRWPRLAGPVLIAVLFSWLLFALDAYRFAEAGRAVSSAWLESFATAFPTGARPDLSLKAAAMQGTVWTFLRGDCYFDTSLWTMRPEFYGSFAVMALAALLRAVAMSRLAVAAGLIAALAAAHAISVHGVAFVGGLVLAAALPAGAGDRRAVAILALCAGVYLLGYPLRPIGAYAWIDPPRGYESYVSVAGATLIIAAFERSAPLARLLSGRISRLLGQLSFPIYLVHVPVLASLGSAVYLAAGAKAAAIATLVGSIAAAWPLMIANEWWVRQLDRLVTRLMHAVTDRCRGPRAAARCPETVKSPARGPGF